MSTYLDALNRIHQPVIAIAIARQIIVTPESETAVAATTIPAVQAASAMTRR